MCFKRWIQLRKPNCSRCRRMPRVHTRNAADYLPPRPSMRACREAVQKCRGCELYRYATQAVFGEGPASALVMFVGEQPGNDEDLQGRPFVGPAGRLLDRALEEAGIDRAAVYVTNAVKHFKFEERGKRRLHKKPSLAEVNACKPWLEVEVSFIKPDVIVCLGATAAQAVFGSQFRLTKHRGEFVPHPWAPRVTATVHPSAILRAPNDITRHEEYRKFVADLRLVQRVLKAA